MSAAIAPSESLQEREFRKDHPERAYAPQTFLRYSRTGGVINYAVGTPSPVGGPPQPGLWIEQDQFVVRKVRLPSSALVTADDYNLYARMQWKPKRRTVQWNNSLATLQLARVTPLEAKSPQNKWLEVGILAEKQIDQQRVKLSSHSAVREFYTRFR